MNPYFSFKPKGTDGETDSLKLDCLETESSDNQSEYK